MSTTEEKDFESMMNAVSSGNHEELNKIMDAEPTDPATAEAVVEEEGKELVQETPAEEPETPAAVEPEPVTPAAPAVPPADTQATELEQLRAELHKLRSDAGRVPFTQRRIKELETEVATLRATKAAAASNSTEGNAELDPEAKAILDELKETDPVIAKAMEAFLKKSASIATSKVENAFGEYSRTIQESEDDRYFEQQKSVLVQQVPQAYQIFQTNEWQQWKQGLSPGRRAMAESIHADEVITAIHAFAADMQRYNGTPAPVTPQTPAAPAPVVDEAAQRAIQERNRRVNSAAEIATPAAKNTEEFDNDQAFLAMYNKIAKENHIK